MSRAVPSFLQIYLVSQKLLSHLLESVLNSKEELKSVTAQGKCKQRNVRDKCGSGKFLEAKLGVKVFCDDRRKISVLTYESGIGFLNIMGLLEDNFAQDLSLGLFLLALYYSAVS